MALAPSTAFAAPSFWQRITHPNCARSERARLQIERLLDTAAHLDAEPQMHRDFALAALAIYELEGSPKPCDTQLAVLLADALIDSRSGREAQAVQILTDALRVAPDSPQASEAWFKIAIAHAKLGNAKAEKQAYLQALTHAWEPEERANIYGNLAETEMLLGDLKSSVRDFKRAAALAQRPDLQALAYFGLGVALERSGDLPSGLAAIRTATAIRLPIAYFNVASALDLPSVFFQPSYDVHYYKALAGLASGRAAEDAAEKKLEYEGAVLNFTYYIDAASGERVPWVQNAKLYRAELERELARLNGVKAR
jgi:tetratricopeptide (TPR) repeat protein